MSVLNKPSEPASRQSLHSFGCDSMAAAAFAAAVNRILEQHVSHSASLCWPFRIDVLVKHCVRDKFFGKLVKFASKRQLI